MRPKKQENEGPYAFDANSAKERELALLAGHLTVAQVSANMWFKIPPPNLRSEDCTNVEEWVDKLYGANLQRVLRETDPRRRGGRTRGSHLMFRG
ncbi:MAG: hypothetical protein AAGJ35_02205 [Myxococcota bacterium]